jgi:hypothetical protein
MPERENLKKKWLKNTISVKMALKFNFLYGPG